MDNLSRENKNTPPTQKNRLDVFLAQKKGISRSQAQKIIAEGLVQINGRPPKKAGEQISDKDKITFIQKKKIKQTATQTPKPEKVTNQLPKITEGRKSPEKYKIIAETKDYLVVEKPAGMLTHSTMKCEKDSLAMLLAKKYPELKQVGEDPMRPGIVHRLDKEASGLLVVARTNEMFDALKKQFKDRTVEKEYAVLVHGRMPKDWDQINFPIARSKSFDRMSALPATVGGLETEDGKQALTEFLVKKNYINFSFLQVKIHTGRMHQIRVHMLAYNHPVVGDPMYFQKKIKRKWDEKLGRLFLHCTKLSFTDLSGEKQTFTSALPKTLANFLKLLK